MWVPAATPASVPGLPHSPTPQLQGCFNRYRQQPTSTSVPLLPVTLSVPSLRCESNVSRQEPIDRDPSGSPSALPGHRLAFDLTLGSLSTTLAATDPSPFTRLARKLHALGLKCPHNPIMLPTLDSVVQSWLIDAAPGARRAQARDPGRAHIESNVRYPYGTYTTVGSDAVIRRPPAAPQNGHIQQSRTSALGSPKFEWHRTSFCVDRAPPFRSPTALASMLPS
jgi:hypothetical protein